MGIVFIIVGALLLAAVTSTASAAPSQTSTYNGPIASPNGTRWIPLAPEYVTTVDGIDALPPAWRDAAVVGQRIWVLYTPESRATWILLSGVVQSRQMRRPLENLLVVRFDHLQSADTSKDAPAFSQLPNLPVTVAITADNVFNTDPPTAVPAV